VILPVRGATGAANILPVRGATGAANDVGVMSGIPKLKGLRTTSTGILDFIS